MNTNLGTIDFKVLQTKNNNLKALLDATIKSTIKDTPEVLSILSYTSELNSVSRTLKVSFTANTQYGNISITNIGVTI